MDLLATIRRWLGASERASGLPTSSNGASSFHLFWEGIDAQAARDMQLVVDVVPDDELIDAALDVAAEIAANSPFGVWMTKEVMWSNLETGSLQSGIDLENRTQILASLTEDSRRAMGGFLSRKPIAYENR